MSRAAPSGGRSPRQREGSDAATARGAPAVATARGGGAAAAARVRPAATAVRVGGSPYSELYCGVCTTAESRPSKFFSLKSRFTLEEDWSCEYDGLAAMKS